MKSFREYGDIAARAFQQTSRQPEILEKKSQLLSTVYEIHNFVPERILFVGFTPLCLATTQSEIALVDVGNDVVDYVRSRGKDVTVLDSLSNLDGKFDLVVAAEEYFTFAQTEEQQRQLIADCCAASSGLVITTLRDYKNQDFRTREFSTPVALKSNSKSTVYLEYHDYRYTDRYAWDATVFELGSELTAHGVFHRRALFFKQLAKFSKDAGAHDFLIHKNLMYKSPLRKNYEHVISLNRAE
jgi:hypothetical protein